MKTKIALFTVTALWLATLALWHIDRDTLTRLYGDCEMKLMDEEIAHNNSQDTANRTINALTQEKDRLRAEDRTMAQAFLDEFAKNQKMVKLAEQMNDGFDKYSASVQANQNSLEQQNAILRATLATPAPIYSVPISTPVAPQMPTSTITSRMIIHPDGSMSDIILDTH